MRILALIGYGFLAWIIYSAVTQHKPTADELFGCKQTYVNAKGEDTGECN